MGQVWPVKLRYTAQALREIDSAISYIGQRSPDGARNVAKRFQEILTFLEERPYAGVATGKKNTRRFFLKPYPYIVYYRIHTDEVIIQRFRHTSRKGR
ncbi:type II toxin-antitoxin system RelE/ParE family toxin [Xaviernesmea oryzae]|uniref:type II toxin-antitoxin system RelE/ParE family toxin n=1 Tax=Xaviernesmea oryzae TaxID=464029 RepID=UPI000A193D3E